MNVLGVQLDIAWEDPAENHRRVDALIDAHAPAPGTLIILPEMFASGFTDNLAIATDPEGATARYCEALARRTRCHLIAGLADRAPTGRGRNLAAWFDPSGARRQTYHKVHPFFVTEAPCFDGGATYTVWSIDEWQVQPSVCYDLRFPELYRAGSKQGAELLLVIANWPIARVEHWMTLLRARAIENQAYVIGINRVGRDPNVLYPGRSQIIDYKGIVLADAGDEPGVIQVQLGRMGLHEYRKNFPFLRDRRL
ncbi:MAG TPA: nitrilase-related carbon-nitrogen hydrolase [Tepidisphaeraceae bacterium]|nr:nitrilase-related carbon-nitrogen hydrolase [Tepidisphaeraceae bacterium]